MGDDGKIRVRLPGSSVVADYASQRERDQSIRLAQARQKIAERTGYIPPWEELGEDDREMAILEARNWLRAAVECGLSGEAATDSASLLPDADALVKALREVGDWNELPPIVRLATSLRDRLRQASHDLARGGKPYSRFGDEWIEVHCGRHGRGLCSCGESSPVLGSDAARRRWHWEHKDEMRRGKGSDGKA